MTNTVIWTIAIITVLGLVLAAAVIIAGVVIINTSRGALVDAEALLEGIKERKRRRQRQ